MAVSIAGMSPEDWQEWHDAWMRRVSAADGDWESCAMHWYPLGWDDDHQLREDDDGRLSP